MPTTQLMIEALVEMRHDPGGISPEHFWQLVERFRADLVNQAFAVLGNQQDAEDVAQESLCQAFQDLSALRDPRALGAWLRSINRHNAVRLVRYRRQKAEREERLPTGAQPVERGWQQARSSDGQGEMLERLVKAIDGLAEEYREVVLFRYWEHLSYEEIAARLGVPLGTVKSRLARADRHLFQRLRTTLPQEEAPKKRSASRRSQRVVSED